MLSKLSYIFSIVSNKEIGLELLSYKSGIVLWNTLDTNNFFFLLFNFSDFILILCSFSFLIFFWMTKRHVTLQSHDMSHDVTS